MKKLNVVLGEEYDEPLKDAIRAVLASRQAIRIDSRWGVGGSQEVQTLIVRIGEDLVTIEAETYMGLSIEGPKSLVESLVEEVRRKLKSA